ncbi:uncharacterized protein LOC111016321 isoform X2 [Momordica charantia]|uniref:Uncharacterized protein LOC111016321 isoform X2 n=1 Tax=Momordica charantia TaxID=3673 RepID=A0A6J1D005_MOMCH|nr:uncharacterized protein LOC111016321 isoform X2 [Momordica charantia]
MNSSEKELEEQLKEIGSELLKPPSSTEALLKALDKAECLLTNVEQSPSQSMQDALLPLMKALISNKLLKHSEEDVKVTVTYCVTEITRITAPDAPYDDEKMKVIFQLTVEAFKKLSNVSGDRCYTRALSILDAVAKVRSSLVMLDLECDNLILEMFHNFLKLIRSNHPPAVFSAMEAIMTNVLDESEEITSDLLSPILASVRKENWEAASISWKLGEKVISNCATKLQPYLMGAVKSLGATLDDYAPIVSSICQKETNSIDAGKYLENEKSLEKGTNSNESMPVPERHTPNVSCGENPRTDGVSESLISNGTIAASNDNTMKESSRKSRKHSKQSKMIETKKPDSLDSTKAENTLDSVPQKRGRKPNSLMNPDEGYDHYWIGKGREKSKLSNRRKSIDHETKFSHSASPKVEMASLPTLVEKESSANVEAKPIKSKDEVVYENMIKMEEKAQARSRKSKVVKSKKDKATLNPGCVISEEKVSVPSDRKEKRPVHLVMKLRVKSTNGDGSLVQKDVIVKSVDTNMDKNVHKSSTFEKKVSRSTKLDSDDCLEETPKENDTRKDAIVEKEVMDISVAGEELVGRRIKVWWPLDRKFYEGVVHSFDPVNKKHKVSYDDGDEEVLNLKKQRYELIGGAALPVGDEEMDVPEPEASSDIVDWEREKGKLSQNQQPRKKRPVFQPEGVELQPRGILKLNRRRQVAKLPIVPCSRSLLSLMNHRTIQGALITAQKEMTNS